MVGLCTSRMAAEGAAARLFDYIESGSFHYLVRNYEGDESTVETVDAGDLVGCYPYSFRARRPPRWRCSSRITASPSSISTVASIISPISPRTNKQVQIDF